MPGDPANHHPPGTLYSPAEEAGLSARETQRYARHLVLPEVGLDGQRRLRAARILLVGAGGLGSPAALYLAAAGVGHLTLIDGDDVDRSNLHRQVLYDEDMIGRPKVEAAAARLRAMNPDIEVRTINERLSADNALRLVSEHDVVIDGSDNFATRYLVNDACVLAGVPNVHGAVFRFEGQVSVFGGEGPCYRCLFRSPPPAGLVPSCAEGGVLGVLPGLVGTIQATEALKIALGIGTTLHGRLLLVDAHEMRFDSVRVARDPACPLCGDEPSIDAVRAVSDPRAQGPPPVAAVEPAELMAALQAGRVHVVDVREAGEREALALQGARHVPLGRLDAHLDDLPDDKDIVFVCASGPRSAQAAARCAETGRTCAILAGGLQALARFQEGADAARDDVQAFSPQG